MADIFNCKLDIEGSNISEKCVSYESLKKNDFTNVVDLWEQLSSYPSESRSLIKSSTTWLVVRRRPYGPPLATRNCSTDATIDTVNGTHSLSEHFLLLLHPQKLIFNYTFEYFKQFPLVPNSKTTVFFLQNPQEFD